MARPTPPQQTIELATLIRAILDAQKNWHTQADIIYLAYNTAHYLHEAGVQTTQDGLPVNPGALYTQQTWRRMVTDRGLLDTRQATCGQCSALPHRPHRDTCPDLIEE